LTINHNLKSAETSIVVVCEAITVLLITLAAVIVLVRLAAGTAPTGKPGGVISWLAA
jgi:hypothetical protein